MDSLKSIVIVSGLPRSGTSLMMSMLQAGGVELLVDHLREADENNPRGYFEYEKVKRLKSDNSWLDEAEGKAVKVVSTLLDSLPDQFAYKVIFMHRTMAEIIESQSQMLAREGKKPATDNDRLALFFSNHLQKIEKWLGEQQNYSTCTISFNALFSEEVGDCIEKIDTFFGGTLDQEAMLAVIDKGLYRKRVGADNIG